MAMSEEEFVVLRQKILAVKDDVLTLAIDIAAIDSNAGRSMQRARAALFEAWTLMVGPPEEDEEDH